MKTKVNKDAKKADAKEPRFCLSQEEYDKMLEAHYAVESMTRILWKHCHDHEATNTDFSDIAFCLGLCEEKIEVMGQLFGN